jgi:imidazolonepropionase-like amidohydrolase
MLTAAPPAKDDFTVFELHKFLAQIGSERDSYTALPDGGTEVKAVFAYNDRGSTVALAATYTFAPSGALRRYAAFGRTSRLTKIDDHIEALADGSFEIRRVDQPTVRVAPRGLAVVVPGYAPMLGQELLVRAWNQHGRPATLAVIPDGEIAIESRGRETYHGQTGPVTLEHLAVRGLVWGREDLWLDDTGALAAVVTRDAEFDPHEAARRGFTDLIPELTRRAGVDGVAALAAAAHDAEHGTRGKQGVIALVGGRLIDGTGRAAIPDAVVVIDGDRITAAGPRTSVAIPANAEVIDVAGASIVPGLWDMHAHVGQVEQGASYLAAGVTTVRDMGNILEFITGVRDAIAAGTGLGPRILVDGLVDGAGTTAVGTVRITSRADIAPTIDRLIKLGCSEVKIYSAIAPALVAPIAAYAHGHGLRVVGHIPNGMTAREAIDAGYDSISHQTMLFNGFGGAPPVRSLAEYIRRIASIDIASAEFARLASALVAHHVVIDDTLALDEQTRFTEQDNARREPGIATLPRELLATLGGIDPAMAQVGGDAFAHELAIIGALHKRGVGFMAGTDIGVPGHSVHREIELYVMAGFTPMEAIQAATIVPARYMHQDRDSGTVEAGKRADLVVVRGDPLADPSAIRKTWLVVARGRVYDSASLWKLVGFRPMN